MLPTTVTTELEADGHLQLTGGPNDVLITATQGDLRLNMHTARFFNVAGSQGVRRNGTQVSRILDSQPHAVSRGGCCSKPARAAIASSMVRSPTAGCPTPTGG